MSNTEQDTIKTQLDALQSTLEALRREIAELRKGNGVDLQAFKTPAQPQKDWLTGKEAMTLTGSTRLQTFKTFCRKHEINPKNKFGRRKLYPRAKVLAALKA